MQQHDSSAHNRAIEVHPDIQRILAVIIERSHELADVLHEVFHLQHQILPPLYKQYEQYFGILESDIQQAQLIASEYARTVELIRMKQQRGQRITHDDIVIINTIVAREFARIRKRIHSDQTTHSTLKAQEQTHETVQHHTMSRQHTHINETSKHATTEIVRLYKSLAKKLHPDSHEKISHADRYWQSVQEYYKQKNTTRLREMYDMLCADTPLDMIKPQDQSLPSLQQRVRGIERQIVRAKKKLSSLRKETIYSIAEQLQQPSWRDRYADTLLQQRDALQQQAENDKHEITILCLQCDITEWETVGNIKVDQSESMTNDVITNSMYFGSPM
jgi:DNA-binding protein Fis